VGCSLASLCLLWKSACSLGSGCPWGSSCAAFIYGTVDFVFGAAKAIFEHCTFFMDSTGYAGQQSRPLSCTLPAAPSLPASFPSPALLLPLCARATCRVGSSKVWCLMGQPAVFEPGLGLRYPRYRCHCRWLYCLAGVTAHRRSTDGADQCFVILRSYVTGRNQVWTRHLVLSHGDPSKQGCRAAQLLFSQAGMAHDVSPGPRTPVQRLVPISLCSSAGAPGLCLGS